MSYTGRLPVYYVCGILSVCFYSVRKSAFSPCATRCTDSREIWHGKGHLGPLSHVKFHLNRRTGVGTRPKNVKKFHFLVKILPPAANALTDFYKC